MKLFFLKIQTALALGIPNVFRVIKYRFSLKLRLNQACRLQTSEPKGPFFNCVESLYQQPLTGLSIFQSTLLFSRWPIVQSKAPPAWHTNPLNGKLSPLFKNDWWLIPDFDKEIGDIKVIWELSRMNWVLAFAQHASNGKKIHLERLNLWLADWCAKNTPFKGPNWKCGQEASIRVLNIALAALIMKQVHSATPSLIQLIRMHLQRIETTLLYAISQDNNHGTSEASALFIGGTWLSLVGDQNGDRWAKLGRYWLENRAKKLIGSAGSFSQYSLNYHRLMLDTFSIVEVWRRYLNLPAFSNLWLNRMIAATEWLRHMVNPFNGDGPNLGANDGARILNLSNTKYRDFRPSVQLAMILFTDKMAYQRSNYKNNNLYWLNILSPKALAKPIGNYIADDGGFAILRRRNIMTMLRYPRFRFRPSQADTLHLDLWVQSMNILRDGGTYSYNTENRWLDYFGGVESHNTIQFDDREQMPRLGRFLFGSWLKTKQLIPLQETESLTSFGVSYLDGLGVYHCRNIILQNTKLRVTDEVRGSHRNAVLRWRLMPGEWRLKKTLNGGQLKIMEPLFFTLNISANVPITRIEIVQGWESRHYLEKTPLPVLELEIEQAGTLISDMAW